MTVIERLAARYAFPSPAQVDEALALVVEELDERTNGIVDAEALEALTREPEVRAAMVRLASVVHAAARLDPRLTPLLDLLDETHPGWSGERKT